MAPRKNTRAQAANLSPEEIEELEDRAEERRVRRQTLTEDDLLEVEAELDAEAHAMLGRFEQERARWGWD